MAGKSHLPTPGADVQVAPQTCDVCGPAEDTVTLIGPAGDVHLCQDCIGALVDRA